MRFLPICTAAVLSGSLALADEQGRGSAAEPNGDVVMVPISGIGRQSCAWWLSNPPADVQTAGWILGFWTGLNVAWLEKTGWATDAYGILGEVKKTCQDEPSLTVVEAARRAYERLRVAGR